MILRGGGSGQPRQSSAIVPGHPLRWMPLQFLGVPLQLGQIVEWIGAIQLARVDQTHEQVTDPGAVQRLIEECVLAVQNGFLQGTLDDVMPRSRIMPCALLVMWVFAGESLVLGSAAIGIIRDSPETPAGRPSAGTGPA